MSADGARPVMSVVKNPRNGPLIAEAARLWINPDALVMDVTYGKGNFWTHYRPSRLIAHDLILDGVDFLRAMAEEIAEALGIDGATVPEGSLSEPRPGRSRAEPGGSPPS